MKQAAFLAHIRRQLARAELPLAAEVPPPPLLLPEVAEPAGLPDQFATALTAVSGHCHHVSTPSEAVATVTTLFADHSVRRYLAWDDEQLPVPGLNDHLLSQGYQRFTGTLPPTAQERTARQQSWATADIGVTGVMGAIAATGSVVVATTTGRFRAASLFPPIHIALLTTSQLYPTLQQFIRAFPRANFTSSNVTIITGPSRTADIEQILTLGVHGPHTVYAILIHQ